MQTLSRIGLSLCLILITQSLFPMIANADCVSKYDEAIFKLRNKSIQAVLTVGKIASFEIKRTGRIVPANEFEGFREAIALDYSRTYLLLKSAEKGSSPFLDVMVEVKKVRPDVTAEVLKQEILEASKKHYICEGRFSSYDHFIGHLASGAYKTPSVIGVKGDPYASASPDALIAEP